MSRVALVTCHNIPEPDQDEAILLTACHAEGLDAEYVPWESAEVDWRSFDMAILRSTWNYYERENDFRQWVRTVSRCTRLWNPAGLVLRTIHKSYLLTMEDLGVPIVPTRFIPRTSPQFLRDVEAETEWTEFVIKPAVSAASYMTRRFGADELAQAQRFLDTILSERDAMVQKFMPEVARGGELAIVCIEGEITHAVVKMPRFCGDHESVSKAMQPNAEQTSLANKVMSTIEEPWLYARIDLMLVEDGTWVLSELEVIEPSLFLVQHPPAVNRLVRGIERAFLPEAATLPKRL